MSKFDLDTMFGAIQSAMAEPEKQSSIDYSNIMRLEIGNTYKVRLLPFVGDPGKTYYHYYNMSWTSKATDQMVQAISPHSFGEPCPIYAAWQKGFKGGSKTNTSGIRRAEQWLVNAYIIDDPVHPENNGTVKIIRFGSQLNNVIKDATSGQFKDELGKYIYDLGPDGYTLNITVTKQQEYANYTTSSFARRPSAIPGVSDNEDKIVEIYESAFDLYSIFPVKQYDALKQMLEEHYYVADTTDVHTPVAAKVITESVEQAADQAVNAVKEKVEAAPSTTTSDAELDALINDL